MVTGTDNPAWATDLLYGDHFIYGTSGLAAPEGYPICEVPAGIAFGVPMGVSFFGTAFSEPTLIKLASGFEAVTQVRANNLPTFAATVPFDHIQGTKLKAPQVQRAQSGALGLQAKPNSQAGKETKKPHHL